jgi:dipeptidyl-peptidase-4
VTLHLYDLTTQKTEKIELGAYEYIAKIQWTNDKELLTAQTLNRRQDDLKLIQINRKSLQTKLLLNEKSDTYINVRDYFTFLKDNSFIMSSERDGWEHLYLYNADGSLKNQITKGEFDVLNFFGVDETTQKIFYQSTENGSINKTVYAIGLNGKNKKLLSRDNRATNNRHPSVEIRSFSSTIFQMPKRLPFLHCTTKKVNYSKEIKDNTKLSDKLQRLLCCYQRVFYINNPKWNFQHVDDETQKL